MHLGCFLYIFFGIDNTLNLPLYRFLRGTSFFAKEPCERLFKQSKLLPFDRLLCGRISNGPRVRFLNEPPSEFGERMVIRGGFVGNMPNGELHRNVRQNSVFAAACFLRRHIVCGGWF